jgi:excisionase family DNA binding protein
MTTSKSLLSIEDAATELGVCRTMVFRFLKDGALKKIKLGRRTLIRSDDLRAFIDATAQQTAA